MCISHSREFGAFGYLNLDGDSFPSMGKLINIFREKRIVPKYTTFITKLLGHIERDRKSKQHLKHHFDKYKPDAYLPFWVACKSMDYGLTLHAFRGFSNTLKQEVASDYCKNNHRIAWEVLDSWLETLRYVRNVCAHHDIIWDKKLKTQPMIPRRKGHSINLAWHKCNVDNKHIFSVLTLIRFMLKTIIPKSKWKQRLLDLLDEFDEDAESQGIRKIPKDRMGFPTNWRKSPIWK